MTAPVLDLINPSTVSRLLHDAGLQRNETIGSQRRPFDPLPRTGGYRVRQTGAAHAVEVTVYYAETSARAQAYAEATAALAAAGYDVAPTPQPNPLDALTVSRRRAPTLAEWAALEDLGGRPRIVAPGGMHEVPRRGLDGIPADVVAALWRSELAAMTSRVPMLLWPDSDVRREGDACVIGLTAAGVTLLTERNKARRARADWALIGREHRWPPEAPALLDGDPGRDAIAAARAAYQPVSVV